MEIRPKPICFFLRFQKCNGYGPLKLCEIVCVVIPFHRPYRQSSSWRFCRKAQFEASASSHK